MFGGEGFVLQACNSNLRSCMQEQIVNAVTALDKSLRLNKSKDVDSLLLMGKLLPQTVTSMPAQTKVDLLKEGAQYHSSNPEVQVLVSYLCSSSSEDPSKLPYHLPNMWQRCRLLCCLVDGMSRSS